MITMTIEEVLQSAIEQIERLQSSITEFTGEPGWASTDATIRMMEDAIKSPASQQVVVVNEANLITKS